LSRKERKKSNKPIYLGVIAFFLVIGFFSFMYVFEKTSDPIRVEIIDNDTETGKVLYKITHLNDGTIDYVFNFTESMGTTTYIP